MDKGKESTTEHQMMSNAFQNKNNLHTANDINQLDTQGHTFKTRPQFGNCSQLQM